MFHLPETAQGDLLAHADEYVGAKVNYGFAPLEKRVLEQFFTNLDQKIFFVHGLPANVLATLGAMYSRMANPRGIRGVFVDTYIVSLIAGTLPEVETEHGGKVADFLKAKCVGSFEEFYDLSAEARECCENFLKSIVMDPKYVQAITNTQRTKGFLSTWLDAYGHNSIARVASVTMCFEGISILAAKSLEWARPGAGYIERSTRYVNMTDPQWYPIENEVQIMGDDRAAAEGPIKRAFELYAELLGTDMDGEFPAYLFETYGSAYSGNDAALKLGVMGESFDVLGNFLPAATLTSVCATVSGEALPSVLRHLLLDGTPENNAIVQMILKEAAKIGANQFCRHYEPTGPEYAGWSYLATEAFENCRLPVYLQGDYPTRDLLEAFRMKAGFSRAANMEEVHALLYGGGRADHDKLPNEFEDVRARFKGTMSFRGWRDLHRQGFSTHRRTLLTPELGFYAYDKPHPEALDARFANIETCAKHAWRQLTNVPVFMRQFILPLGFNVGFTFGCNARQAEFCNWQRTDYSVNHEVRQMFLAMENALRRRYKWWAKFSRADMTPKYVFARGKPKRELTE